MTSWQHSQWISRGSPWRVARPVGALVAKLRGYGYTVYTLGDNSHLDHEPPEDHTPYSETGWPVASPYGVVFACDIMPPPAGLPSLQQLGAQMVADRNAGVPGISWLKYQNWEPERNNGGACYQDRWKPNYTRVSSGDRGHIHQSGRSDMADSTVGDTYDPVARVRGITAAEGSDMDANQAQQLTNVHDIMIKMANGKMGDIHPHVPNSPVNGWLKAAADGVAELNARSASASASFTDAQVADFADRVVAVLGPRVDAVVNAAVAAGSEAAADRAVRKALGSLDGAVPPAGG